MLTATSKAICFAIAMVGLVMTGGNGCQNKPKHESLVHAHQLEPYSCGSIQRLHTYQGIFLASQPQQADLERAAQGGIKTVINLRLPDEVKDFDEEQVVTDLDMTYHNPGFDGPAMLTDAIFDRVRGHLNDAAQKPMLIHCSSANRVGAIWLAHRVLDSGLTMDQALAEAKTVGLKLPAYEEKAKNYIKRHQP